MGGHGGLNILPQKKWNVYNWDNRIKVMQNEKLVKDELEKRNNSRKEKIFREKIDAIKNGEVFNEETYYKEEESFDQKEKNRIFSEIMKRKTLEKQVDNEVYFENRFNPLQENEQLSLFDKNKLQSEYEKNLSKKNFDSDEEKNRKILNKNYYNIYNNNSKFNNNLTENSEKTFKESIKDHLQPWYIKKDKDDYIKKLKNLKKYFSNSHENAENSDVNSNFEEEIDKNKLLKNYEEYYENLEFDINNKISVKDYFKNKSIFKNNKIDIDSDHLEFLKGEKNLSDFLKHKRKLDEPIEKKEKITVDDLYVLINKSEHWKKEKKIKEKKDKKNKKHKKDKKDKRKKKDKKEEKYKKEKNDY